ncbi:CoA-transferase subunit beta [Halobacterium sp. KA-6]|jgi:glutaconate CoA-transferase subunit B|uniref:CoA-transferase subunit beta n=1 Tax=Halobacterium sp. KA-6 TaxID=2896368 RepID=UPI001E4F770B|nr:CoA-transferase [Halobacterium sp. KA-6]MCD2203654.1 CoA-transferase subunit beta [Halobacterium sp. KA-6]
MSYSDTELMVVKAAQELRDGDSVLVGIGIPNLAANLAKRTHAPDLRMIYESGTIDSDPSSLPLSIGDPVLASGAASIESLHGGFNYYLQAGRIDAGFLGGAQVDKHGNINSTVIGDYDDPDVRLPGSGGACEIASNVERTIITTSHQRQRFPEEVDFVTSPGFIDGEGGREKHGLQGGGPAAVITDMAVMGFQNEEMVVESIHPGVDREDVQEATGWDIKFAGDVDETEPPTEDELRLIREELDPDGVYL